MTGAVCHRSRRITSIRRRRGRIWTRSSAPRMRPASNWSNDWRSIRLSAAGRTHGSIPRCGPRCCVASTPTDGRAPMNGRPERGPRFPTMLRAAADELRQAANGDVVSYVVTRNINYTNICYFKCGFCAFSKGKVSETLRGRPYDISLGEIERRVREAWARGATEVCMQGGVHPSYTGAKYLDICRAVKSAEPDIHIHAFSPLEVHQGAATLRVPLENFLRSLQATGLGTLPGTAAEILDDEVRAVLCPDKIRTHRWLEVMRAAHR